MDEMCLIDRKTGEQLCRRKLEKVSSSEEKLYQSVLLRNTLKFIETADELKFCCHAHEEYEPSSKRRCFNETVDRIDDILKEMIFLKPLLLPPEDDMYPSGDND